MDNLDLFSSWTQGMEIYTPNSPDHAYLLHSFVNDERSDDPTKSCDGIHQAEGIHRAFISSSNPVYYLYSRKGANSGYASSQVHSYGRSPNYWVLDAVSLDSLDGLFASTSLGERQRLDTGM